MDRKFKNVFYTFCAQSNAEENAKNRIALSSKLQKWFHFENEIVNFSGQPIIAGTIMPRYYPLKGGGIVRRHLTHCRAVCEYIQIVGDEGSFENEEEEEKRRRKKKREARS